MPSSGTTAKPGIYKGLPVAEAVKRALAAPRWPVVLADVGDNVGGGTPGDGTSSASTAQRRGRCDAVVTLADPQAVQLAQAAGAGATIDMPIGGKVDHFHGEPLLLTSRSNA